MKNYSKEQMEYKEAVKEYDQVLKKIEVEKETSGVNKLIDNTRELRRERMNLISTIENKLGKWKVYENLLKVEKSLIEWAYESTIKFATDQNEINELKKLHDNYDKFPAIREKMIDVAMKLKLTGSLS